MTSLILNVNIYATLNVYAYVTWNQVSILTFYSNQSSYWNLPLGRTKLACYSFTIYPIQILLLLFFKGRSDSFIVWFIFWESLVLLYM